jgi:hypothetical protein
MVPSVGGLLYQFADDLLGPGPGPQIPCRNTSVRERPLARLILAATFWDLRQCGLISLELAPWGEPRGRKKQVFALPIGEDSMRGLTGGVLAALHRTGPGATAVRLVVSEWFGKARPNPEADVLEAAVQELEEGGYYRTVDAARGHIAGFLFGHTRLEVDCDRINRLWDDYRQLATKWRRFVDEELALSQALLAEAGRGIKLRTDESY